MRQRVSSRFLEGLFYALTVFAPFAFGCVEPWSRAVLEVLAFLLALACFLRGRETVSAAAEFWLFPAGFAAAGVVQLMSPAAPDGPRPWLPFTAAPHGTETAVLLWAAYAALLWSVPRILVTHESARRYVRFLFGLGLVLAAFGMLQALMSPDNLYWVRPTSRAGFGPFYDRDDAANVMMMCMAGGIGLFFSRIRRGAAFDGPPERHFWTQAGIGGGVLFLFVGIIACTSRGALLAVLFTGALMTLFGADFARRSRQRRARAAAAITGAAFVLLLAFQYVGAGADAGAKMDSSVMGRFSIYGDAQRWWRDTPLFGTGLGSFETVYPSYQDMELRATVAHAHSDWLEIFLEAGIAGLAAALAAAGLFAFFAFRLWRAARSDEMRALIGGGLAAAAAFAVHSFFEFCFQIPGNAVVFLGVVGFLLSAPAWADKTVDRPRSHPPSPLLSLAAIAGFFFMAQAAVRPAAAAWLADESGSSDARTSALTRAYALDADPYFLMKLSQIDYGSDRDGLANLKRLRDALSYSLSAVDQRPFDFQALSYAGASLWRLGRLSDARALIDEALTVRFSPLVLPSPDEKSDFSRKPGKR